MFGFLIDVKQKRVVNKPILLEGPKRDGFVSHAWFSY